MSEERNNELLLVLQEEAAEIIHAASKILRFGDNEDNRTRLENEIGDFMGVLKLLSDEKYLSGEGFLEQAEKKIRKLDTFMKHKK